MYKIIFFIIKKIKKLVAGRKLGRKFPWILKFLNFLYLISIKKHKSNLVLTNVLNFKMFVNPMAKCYIVDGEIERFTTKLFMKEIKSGDVVVDIGANWGYFTLLSSFLVGKNGKVYAFEPEPYNYELLYKNIRINKCKNVFLFKKACANKKGMGRLYISSDIGFHSLYFYEDKSKYIEVELITLDEIFKGREEEISLIKIDIEGGEIDALQGGNNILLKNNKLKIIIEFYPERIIFSGHTPEDLYNELIKYNFTLFYIDDDNEKLIKVYDVKQCTKLCMTKKSINLFCVKN